MRPAIKYALIILSLSVVAGNCMYFTYKNKQRPKQSTAAARAEDFLTALPAAEDFTAMQGAPLSAKFNDVRTVKVVYDTRRSKLYFINSDRYNLHYNFCVEQLAYPGTVTAFNSINYGSSGRRDYLLGNINQYGRGKIYTLEFSSQDRISHAQIARLYKAIADSSYIGKSLRVFLGSDHLAAMHADGRLTLPTITPTEIYQGQKYQLLNKGATSGYLRVIDDLEKQYDDISPEDIIIVKGTPVNLPICAGVIATSLQTPLSHINVLCHNRNIPSAVDIDILQRASARAFFGKPVTITISDDSIAITASTPQAVRESRKLATAGKEIRLKYDLSRRGLIAAKDIAGDDANTVGNKAVGMGQLYKLSKKNNSTFSVPEGAFAIPFYYYSTHISHPSVQAEIDRLLQQPSATTREVREQLKRIRKAIKAQPVDAELLAMVNARILTGKAGKSYRFRSSSNAEDMAGFSGAGLYDSKTGIAGDTAKSIERAIKEVWASAWGEPAYTERKWFRIDQRSMMMGVLVHRSFPDEAANGVAITKNIYRRGFPGFTINVQQGEVSVVSPPEGVTCEQFTCLRADHINIQNHDIAADYITHSSITGGKNVLTMQQIKDLYQQLEIIKSYFFYQQQNTDYLRYNDFALDIEFKFEKNGKLYIKQVRPYQ